MEDVFELSVGAATRVSVCAFVLVTLLVSLLYTIQFDPSFDTSTPNAPFPDVTAEAVNWIDRSCLLEQSYGNATVLATDADVAGNTGMLSVYTIDIYRILWLSGTCKRVGGRT